MSTTNQRLIPIEWLDNILKNLDKTEDDIVDFGYALDMLFIRVKNSLNGTKVLHRFDVTPLQVADLIYRFPEMITTHDKYLTVIELSKTFTSVDIALKTGFGIATIQNMNRILKLPSN